MIAQGPKSERETTINFNEDDNMAAIWTASSIVYRRLLKRLGRAYLTEDGERHAVFTFPQEFLHLPKTKRKRVLTEAQRAKIANRLARTPKIQDGNEQKEPVLNT